MPRYRVFGVVTGSKYLGTVEAETKEEAEKKAFSMDECYVSVCHQCSSQISDPEIHEVIVEKQGE